MSESPTILVNLKDKSARSGAHLVGLLFHNTHEPIGNIMRKDARDLIARGLGSWVRHGKAVRLLESIPGGKPKWAMGKGMPTDYAPAYDRIGLEKYPHEVLGGLVRTETQPVIASRAPGWRPLH